MQVRAAAVALAVLLLAAWQPQAWSFAGFRSEGEQRSPVARSPQGFFRSRTLRYVEERNPRATTRRASSCRPQQKDPRKSRRAHARRRGRHHAAKTPRYVTYTGLLQNAQGRPISGVFPMTFALYPSEKAKRPKWKEHHWVAVDAGVYTVELGHDHPIPRSLDLNRSILSISLDGVGEIVRDKPVLAPPPAPAAATATQGGTSGASTAVAPTAAPAAAASTPGATRARAGGTVVDYAERAGYAFEAEHATNADKLQNLTLDELQKRLSRPIRISHQTRTTEGAGGKGGYDFEYLCPKGYVAVGIKGRSGIYVDYIQLVCAKLE